MSPHYAIPKVRRRRLFDLAQVPSELSTERAARPTVRTAEVGPMGRSWGRPRAEADRGSPPPRKQSSAQFRSEDLAATSCPQAKFATDLAQGHVMIGPDERLN